MNKNYFLVLRDEDGNPRGITAPSTRKSQACLEARRQLEEAEKLSVALSCISCANFRTSCDGMSQIFTGCVWKNYITTRFTTESSAP